MGLPSEPRGRARRGLLSGAERQTSAKEGFTLVELLVVITIIMLLIGLLVVLIRGIVDKARNTKTAAIVKMLDQGCHSYHTDYGVFPPNDMSGSASLHKYLGKDRMIDAQFVESGVAPKIKKPPIIQFNMDILDGNPTTTEPNPPVKIIDAWGKPVRYANPGVKNRKAVDIWSDGKDDTDPADDINNWDKDY